jgi:hypothetical protein
MAISAAILHGSVLAGDGQLEAAVDDATLDADAAEAGDARSAVRGAATLNCFTEADDDSAALGKVLDGMGWRCG